MRYSTIIPFVLLLSASTLLAGASDRLLDSLKPQQGRAVYDHANVISSGEEQQIESMIAEVRQKADGSSIVVVMLPSLEGGEIDDFTNRLFEKWGVGQRGKDNGLLFLAAMEERAMRIEVGYGLEGAIPDSVAGRIRRDVITPYFQQNQPGRGVVAGVAALSQEIALEHGATLTGEAARIDYRPRNEREGFPIMTLLFLLFFIPFAIRHPFLAMMLLSGGRGGGGGHRSSGGFGGGGFGGFGGGMSGGGSSGRW